MNASSGDTLDAVALAELVADRLGTTARFVVTEGTDVSPFSFDRWYPMDNRRATALGFRFSRPADWLPAAVAEAVSGAP